MGAAAIIVAMSNTYAIVQHPMDPLEDTEILGAAFILQGAGVAQPGAIFQSIDLREPPKEVVLAFHPGDPITRAATVYLSPEQEELQDDRRISTTARSRRPQLIPKSDGQLGLTITEVSDFTFAFQDPAFLQALAMRGITTPDQLANVLVTPLTPGSFGLPEESRRIVKAQMYYRENQPRSTCTRSRSKACRRSWISTTASCSR